MSHHEQLRQLCDRAPAYSDLRINVRLHHLYEDGLGFMIQEAYFNFLAEVVARFKRHANYEVPYLDGRSNGWLVIGDYSWLDDEDCLDEQFYGSQKDMDDFIKAVADTISLARDHFDSLKKTISHLHQ